MIANEQDRDAATETEWERMGRPHRRGEPEPGLAKRISHFVSHMDGLLGLSQLGRAASLDREWPSPVTRLGAAAYRKHKAVRTSWRWAAHWSGKNLSNALSAADEAQIAGRISVLVDCIWDGGLGERKERWEELKGSLAHLRNCAEAEAPHSGSCEAGAASSQRAAWQDVANRLNGLLGKDRSANTMRVYVMSRTADDPLHLLQTSRTFGTLERVARLLEG